MEVHRRDKVVIRLKRCCWDSQKVSGRMEDRDHHRALEFNICMEEKRFGAMLTIYVVLII